MGGHDGKERVLHNVVVDLVQPWAEVHLTLYFGNLDNFPFLCDDLLQMVIRSCGTCRSNRSEATKGLRKLKKTLPKSEMMMWQRGQLDCVMWQDNKPVLFLSLHCGSTEWPRSPHQRPASHHLSDGISELQPPQEPRRSG
jgi:hypothetical protein